MHATSTEPHLRDLAPEQVRDEYTRRGLDTVSDHALLELAAGVVSQPRAAEPDSFVLHAPLELLARAALLPHVSPTARPTARQRIVWLAATFETTGPSAELPDVDPVDPDTALDRLRSAITDGELATAGSLGRWLGQNLDPIRLGQLVGDTIVASLAAAAHGPIFLHLLPRVATRSPMAGAMFGSMARELARNPTWQLTWMDDSRRPTPTAPRSLAEALAGTPVLGPPGSNFIFPLMDQAERSGLAGDIAGSSIGPDTDVTEAAVTLQRIATASMLLDDPDQAPYGWSHTLTIPQAVAALAPRLRDPSRALAVAATQIVGFRTGIGGAPLSELDAAVADNGLTSHLFDVPDIQDAIDHAAVHPDAHLAKYVIACLDAARADPAGARQHLAAAGHLSAWWRQLPVADDPLTS